MLKEEDVKQIGDVLRREISDSEKRLTSVIDTKISDSEKRLTSVIDTKISDSEKRISSVMATKTDIKELKSDMEDLKELVQGLIVSSDSIAKAVSDLHLEYSAISIQLSRHDKWIKQIAEKVGLNLIAE